MALREKFGRLVLLEETDSGPLGTEYRAARLGPSGFDRLVSVLRFSPAVSGHADASKRPPPAGPPAGADAAPRARPPPRRPWSCSRRSGGRPQTAPRSSDGRERVSSARAASRAPCRDRL